MEALGAVISPDRVPLIVANMAICCDQYADGIGICKLLANVIEWVSGPRYNILPVRVGIFSTDVLGILREIGLASSERELLNVHSSN